MKNKLFRLATPLFLFLFIFLLSSQSSFASNFRISGRVTDDQGHGIINARINFINITTNETRNTTSYINNDGSYAYDSLPEGTYNIQVIPSIGYGYNQKTVNNVVVLTNTVLNIVLDPAPGSVALTGVIRTPENLPINNLSTSLTYIDSNNASIGISYITGTDGVYFFRILPRSDYKFQILNSRASQDTHLNIPSGFSISANPLSINQDITQDIIIPTQHVTVHVTNPDGQPAQNVSVSTSELPVSFFIPNIGQLVGTNYDNGGGGHATLTNSNGDLTLYLLPSGPNLSNYTVTAYPNLSSYFDNRLITGSEIIDGLSFIISLSTMPTVYGRFVSGIGGLSNQTIELIQNNTIINSVITDDQGNYYAKVPAGNYTFAAHSNGKIPFGPTSYVISGDLNLSASKQISIGLIGATFVGNVNVLVRDSTSPNTVVPSHVSVTGIPVPLSIYNLSNVTGVSNDGTDVDSDGNAKLYLFNTSTSSNGYTITVTPNDPNYLPASINNYLLNGGQEVRVYLTSNQTPTAAAGGPYSVDEGDSVTLNGSGRDPENDPLTYSWDLNNDVIFETPGQNVTFSAANLDGPNTKIVNLQACDTHNACATAQATINILNAVPTVQTITAPTDPVTINSPISTSTNFNDPGILDTHTAIWDWGDGNTSSGVVSESNGSGSVSGTHAYGAAGVYTVILTVTDKDGGIGTSQFQYIVVYDPSPTAGFLTGSGGYESQAGWYLQDTQASGKVKFGIQAKYNSENTLVGQAKFNFKNANLDFESTSYQWLVVSGTKATLKGNGTINGSGNYSFLVTAIEGQNLIRVQIKDSSGSVIYDTQIGAVDTADPTTPLTYGLINVH